MLTTVSLLSAWKQAVVPVVKKGFGGGEAAGAGRRPMHEVLRSLGDASLVTGLVLFVVVVVGLFVVTRAYVARDHNYGIPSAATLLATLVNPLAGGLVLVCSGAFEESSHMFS